jgi:bacteriorhodopsin
LICAGWLTLIWLLYPVAWGLSEGGNVIHPDSEAIFYGVLDICAKPIFGAPLIWGHRTITAADLGRVRATEEKVLTTSASPVTVVETAAPVTTTTVEA